MVLIAILGAITAYRGAVAEMESALLEQTLDQGRLLELYFRQDKTDGVLLREMLSVRKGDYERLARTLMQQADEARTQNQQERALALDLQAQAEIAAGRALRSVYWDLPSFDDGAYSVEQNLRKSAVQRLNYLGFEATWAAPPASTDNAESTTAASDTIWPDLELDIGVGHARVPSLAFAVAGFVAALVLLTIADISRAGTRKRLLFYLGSAFGLLPVAFAIYEDSEIWYWFAATAVAFGALTALGWWFGALQGPEDGGHPFHPAEFERRTYTGGHLLSRTVHDRFSQLAVLTIAGSVLLSAIVGAWFSIADTHARRAALDAVGFEADMLKRGSLFGVTRSIVLEDMAVTMEERARVAVMAARGRLAPTEDTQATSAGP